MTSACPDFDVLTEGRPDELRAHLDACPSCAALRALRLGEPGEVGESCRESESLLAVLACGALTESDERALLAHLASCSRCMTLAADTLLASATPTSELHAGDPKTGDLPTSTWQHAVDSGDDLGDRRRSKRAWMYWSLGAVAAAAILVLVLSPRIRPALVERERPAPVRTTERPAPVEHLSGAARPITTPPATARTVEELVADATAKFKDTDYAGALALCESALVADPDHQGSRQVCAIAACNLGEASRARQHLASISSKTRVAGIRQICLRLGVTLEESASDVDASSAKPSAECQDKTELRRADITKGIESIRAEVMACGARAEGLYKVEIAIAPDGSVTSADTRDDEVGDCLATEVKKVRFARSCKGMSVTYPFVFRRASED